MVKLTDRQLLIVGGLAVLAAWYAANRVKAAVVAAAPLVNPFDERNLAYTSTNSLLEAITGIKNFNLGREIYDVTHDGTLDVTSQNNVIYRNLEKETQDAWGKAVYDGVEYVKGWWN